MEFNSHLDVNILRYFASGFKKIRFYTDKQKLKNLLKTEKDELFRK